MALWRALHVEVDAPPPVLEDRIGLELLAPDADWRSTPPEMLALAHEAGFATARHVSAADLTQRYFVGRTDGLRPPGNAEELLVAST